MKYIQSGEDLFIMSGFIHVGGDILKIINKISSFQPVNYVMIVILFLNVIA